MKRLLFGIFILIIALSCSKKIAPTTISSIDQNTNLSSKGLIYTLPTTSVKVKVESEYYIFTPGPFARYAQKYLGITGLPITTEKYWAITSVKVYPYNHSDIQSMFVVEPNEEFPVNFLHLTSEGLVIPIGSSILETSPQTVNPKLNISKDLGFVDLSATPFIAAEQTTHYSRVMKDTSYVKVPVHKSLVVEKSLEDKAKEAADFIFSLRKRRFDLLWGDADFVATGTAAEAVLKEIYRLEAEYVSLFTGKEQRSQATHWFDYSPDSQNKEVSSILFRFSAARGVLSSSDLSGSPVLITIKPEGKWQGLDLLENLNTDEKGTPRTDAIYYKLAVPVSVRIHDSQTELYAQILPFYQFGPLLRMPARFVNEKNGALCFPVMDTGKKKKK
jgi:hypothetical protein